MNKVEAIRDLIDGWSAEWETWRGPVPAALLATQCYLESGGAENDWLWRKGAPFTWEEIEANYYDGAIPATPAGCTQIRWPMREGAGTTAASIPTGYNGTLSAASWTTSTRCKARTAV